jgi:thymidylate synthase (FAD)
MQIGIEIIKPSALVLEITPDAEGLIVKCGRVSHMSKFNPDRKAIRRFITKWAIAKGHESILEHATATAQILCDRATSHQIVRHRISSYTMSSQRYCDFYQENDKVNAYLQVVLPPSIGMVHPANRRILAGDEWQIAKPNIGLNQWMITMRNAYNSYIILRKEGIPPEDARGVLPNNTLTTLMITANFRMWRHMIKERAFNPKAQWQIQDIFKEVYDQLVQAAPSVFEDLEP